MVLEESCYLFFSDESYSHEKSNLNQGMVGWRLDMVLPLNPLTSDPKIWLLILSSSC